ncbi:hypothetical protein LPJ66_003024 [Kickxella alabastrina]|uniref:Uncharacterized protein n=1 Tax=Kickxella alabastrina TaxID=61397 RepID=A0ACC1ILR1_9FUNG|nr:hypothetical protein LPJ66_003024 [Kickxella alabastrina]
MRKTTGLKMGLNVRKPTTAATLSTNNPLDNKSTSNTKKSVFSTEDSSAQAPVSASTHIGPKSRASEQLAQELTSTDPSVYAYDELYDNINDARNRIKNARKTDDLRPRYMDKILETAKQRQVQHEVVREKILEKERLREGEVYADKEVFVTKGYKEQKEQRQNLVEEEEKREREEEDKACRNGAGTGGGGDKGIALAAGFYRGFLEQMDREDVSKLVSQTTLVTREPSTGDTQGSSQDGEKELGAGLNLGKSTNTGRSSYTDDLQSASTYQRFRGNTRDSNNAYRPQQRGQSQGHGGTSLQRELDEQSRMVAGRQEQEQQALVRKYARRNDPAAVEAARQRYFERVRIRQQQQQQC